MLEMTEGEINRATFWIRRWKMIGGGFEIKQGIGAIGIEAVRAADPDPKADMTFAQAEGALVEELNNDAKKRRHVFELVRHAHDKRENPASVTIDAAPSTNDDEPPAAA